MPCRACKLSETGKTDVPRNRELVQWHRAQSQLSSSAKDPKIWRQSHPVALCYIFLLSDLLLTLNSSLRAQVVVLVWAFFPPFFCCCSYFPLALITQMHWEPCALPHHKGNHRTKDQKSCQMYLLGRIPHKGHGSGCQTGLTALAKQDGDITCFQKRGPQK